MKDYSTENRRARIGEIKEELEEQISMKWYKQALIVVALGLVAAILTYGAFIIGLMLNTQ
jgi:hypothetical protein